MNDSYFFLRYNKYKNFYKDKIIKFNQLSKEIQINIINEYLKEMKKSL